MAKYVDRKLCLTASLLGAETRKELAAAFRRINPATEFDLQRAHKWLQGRAQPRGRRVYEDWALLIDVGETADWIAECEVDAFVDQLCKRHGVARELLLRRAAAFGGNSHGSDGHLHEHDLIGTYICYSHAWSPYFRGHLVRGTLSIGAEGMSQRLSCTYTEALPIGRLHYTGTVTSTEREIQLQMRTERGPAQMLFWLFEPTPPISVLGGLMSGTTVMGAAPDLSVTRIIMLRLPAPHPALSITDAYLQPDVSLAGDLAGFGLAIDAPQAADGALRQFLAAPGRDGLVQVSVAAYHEVVELFDRCWLGRYHRPAPMEAEPEEPAA